jgi:hypothetical protein
MLPPLASVPGQPPAYVLPSPGWPKVDFEQPDPLLDRPYSSQPGFFANVETSVLWLHLRNQLAGIVFNGLTGAADAVSFAGNKLDPAVSPRFEIGYRLPDNWGSVVLGYRFLASRGRDQLVTGPADVVQARADQVGRFDDNILDLTYVSREYSLDPNWNLRWGFGGRLMFLYFDSRANFLNPGTAAGSVLAQTESNHLADYGFWGLLDVERHTPIKGLLVFGRLEGTNYFARTQERYTETVASGPGAAPLTFANRFNGSVGTQALREVVGLSYEVPEWNHSRFLLGYQYETYFQIGRQTPTNGTGLIDTRGQLDVHGLFLRAELNF